MSEYPAINRIRPIAAPSAQAGSLRREAARAEGADQASPDGDVSIAAALGCLIIGLQVAGASPRRA
ncbi:hypothetical protein [Isoptericola croceus]|uniref:hypothetical protein n=1 Tax=Isoptericola croceus TaxID=3031406 RepID=UPI0023F68E32|nr:hypothetical protein [Isoptericola croceus]